jgi:hypothetical protein
MEIDVNYDEYKADRRSREPTRAQSAARKIAITAWIRQAIADNVIKPSTATAWAQLMLTKKPNGSWRFAVDYRAVNKYTKPMRAPIPNIKKLLHQLGGKKPKLFEKMDFTSGFYQTPVRECDTKYTAFSCDDGLFEFNVASMGLLNSPWYFQRVMETEVFPHLLHRVMSIYVDDILTWAANIDELCENMTKIFEAIRNKGLTLNPAKCEFGMEEVEFVGHLVDQHGVTFTADKLNQVAQMTLPVDQSSLKSFLGLGSFFRNHVENFATKSHALSELLLEYTKKSKKLIRGQKN